MSHCAARASETCERTLLRDIPRDHQNYPPRLCIVMAEFETTRSPARRQSSWGDSLEIIQICFNLILRTWYFVSTVIIFTKACWARAGGFPNRESSYRIKMRRARRRKIRGYAPKETEAQRNGPAYSRLAPIAESALLISWAMDADSRPTTASSSD